MCFLLHSMMTRGCVEVGAKNAPVVFDCLYSLPSPVASICDPTQFLFFLSETFRACRAQIHVERATRLTELKPKDGPALLRVAFQIGVLRWCSPLGFVGKDRQAQPQAGLGFAATEIFTAQFGRSPSNVRRVDCQFCSPQECDH